MATLAENPAASTRRKWRRLWRLGAWLLVAGAGAVALMNYHVLRSARGRTFFAAELLPAQEVGIVLGTSPKTRGGYANPFFESRMDAAAALWHAGKVRHLILSGDNSRREYDEPTAMQAALVARGLPAAATTLDFAGFRTLDTMARARAIFGQHKAVVITDDFHLARALFLARANGIDAVGFGGQPVALRWSRKTRAREILSRVNAWLDVYLLRTGPKFYGPPVTIPAFSGEAAATSPAAN